MERNRRRAACPFYVEREGPQFACVHYLGTGLRYFDLSADNAAGLPDQVRDQLRFDFGNDNDLDVVLSALGRL